MNELKLTPWFGADIKPVRVGVYQVDEEDGISDDYCWYAYFNGERFGYRSMLPEYAYSERGKTTCLKPMAKWRGLAVKP